MCRYQVARRSFGWAECPSQSCTGIEEICGGRPMKQVHAKARSPLPAIEPVVTSGSDRRQKVKIYSMVQEAFVATSCHKKISIPVTPFNGGQGVVSKFQICVVWAIRGEFTACPLGAVEPVANNRVTR